uniref:Uncharacterized protein n=1 Tax=Plectus sambesii TaxID=2011161 RepID=A0A914UND2_9BILA
MKLKKIKAHEDPVRAAKVVQKMEKSEIFYEKTDEFRASRHMVEAEDMEKDEEDLIIDVREAFGKLNNWRAHQVRTVNQNRASADITTGWLRQRPLTGVYMYQDFAQKALPQKFYKSQQD